MEYMFLVWNQIWVRHGATYGRKTKLDRYTGSENIKMLCCYYLSFVADRRHSAIGPSIASSRRILPSSSHTEPYV